MTGPGARIILASGSAARQQMLAAAGVQFQVETAQVDEAALKEGLFREAPCVSARQIAQSLAAAKARDVGGRNRNSYVIGCDQVLACGERIFSKVADRAGAQETLSALRGKTHRLHSAVAIAFSGSVVWEDSEAASLTMRNFSDAFLDRYLDAAGEALTLSVGCYELEGLGVQLFECIEGDYFTILGLPMMPLLAELRKRGAIAS